MANTLNVFRNGANLLANTFGVGFIVWLDARHRMYRIYGRLGRCKRPVATCSRVTAVSGNDSEMVGGVRS